jgi:hypothetical protein
LKTLITLGAVLTASAAVALTFVLTGPAGAEEAADAPSSLVEDYSYPGADAVLAQYGITLKKGDGHLQLADCGADSDNPPADLILVQTNDLTLPSGPNFCFKPTGTTGYLSMEISQVYFIRGEQTRTVDAKVELQPDDAAATTKSVQVDPGEWQPVGVGADEGVATVLELRY